MKNSLITSFSFLGLMLVHMPISLAKSEGIHLRIVENSPTTLSLSVEGTSISKPLIGISATLHLPKGLTYHSYTPGQFLEADNDQITYLISPKKSDLQTIIIGIASLGKTSKAHTGSFVTLHFQKASPSISLTDLKLEKSVASGIQNDQRIDYPNIPWSIDYELTAVGQPLQLTLLVTLLISLTLITIKIRKKLRVES